MAPFISGATGISSQDLANSASFSASASAQTDSAVNASLTNVVVTSSITPLTIDNPLDPRATTTLDALLDTSTGLHVTISPTTSTTALIGPATAEAAAVTANTEAKNARRQAAEVDAGTVQSTADPAKGPFSGGIPTPEDDVLITAIFLVLFALGAFTHISIFRANSKRGHKFLISDLMFDFCMVRVMTCIFRIVWAFTGPRGVVLAATIFQNGGAAVIFAVNLFLAQRLMRSLHPAFGWRPAFSYLSLFLIFSVPAVIVMNIIATAISFFSVGKPIQLQAAEGVLKFGASWNMMLVAMPLLWIFLASATAQPSAEEFGVGSLSRKGSLVVFSASTLAVGAALKLTAILNPADVEAMSPMFTKGAFYTTGFMLEILTVAAYAFFRIDLTFHIPNGASGPGDYSLHPNNQNTKPRSWTAGEVNKEIGKIGIRYELLSSQSGGGDKQAPVIALLHLDSTEHDGSVDAEPEYANQRKLRSVRADKQAVTLSAGRAQGYKSSMLHVDSEPAGRVGDAPPNGSAAATATIWDVAM